MDFLLKIFVFREAKIIRDPQTMKSRGYGFVAFTVKEVNNRKENVKMVFFVYLHESINSGQKLRPKTDF